MRIDYSLASYALRNQHVDLRATIWRSFGFLAKYGHQQIPHLKDMPIREIEELMEGISAIMEDERANFERQLSGM